MKLPKIKSKKKEDWIEKDKKRMIPKLDKRKIFVPSLNELTF
jgi:hypothetical protein